jgi:hypothetical protein
VDVLSDVDPNLARQVGQLELGVGADASATTIADDGQQRLEAALMDFGISLGDAYGYTLSPEELLSAMPERRPEVAYQSEIELRRALFRTVADLVTKHLEAPPDAQTMTRFREAAIARAGLNLDGTVKVTTGPVASASPVADDVGSIIDCEIVAIYW